MTNTQALYEAVGLEDKSKGTDVYVFDTQMKVGVRELDSNVIATCSNRQDAIKVRDALNRLEAAPVPASAVECAENCETEFLQILNSNDYDPIAAARKIVQGVIAKHLEAYATEQTRLLREAVDIALVDLGFALTAVRAGDPKKELDLRIRDIMTYLRRALSTKDVG